MAEESGFSNSAGVSPQQRKLLTLVRDELLEYLNGKLPLFIERAEELIRLRSYTDHVSYREIGYADVLDQLVTASDALQREIKQKYAQQFSRSFGGEENSGLSLDSLSLVSDESLERQIIIDGAVNRALQTGRKELDLLLRRLNFLADTRLSERENPVGPRILLDSFDRAVESLNLHVSLHLLVIEACEEKVLDGIGALYARLNQKLAKAGVLPDLVWNPASRTRPERLVPERDAGAGGAGSGDASAHGGGAGEGQPGGAAHSHLVESLGGILKRIAQRYLGMGKGAQDSLAGDGGAGFGAAPASSSGTAGAGGAGGPGGSTESGGGLAGGESGTAGGAGGHAGSGGQDGQTISGSSPESPDRGAGGAAASPDAVDDVGAIEPEVLLGLLIASGGDGSDELDTHEPLVPQLQQLAQARDLGEIGPRERDLLSLVDGLFEHLKEERLAQLDAGSRLAPVVSRLRMPMARMVLSDPGFITARYHPVRRLYSEISSLLWVFDTHDERFIDRVNAQLEQVIDRIEESPALDRKSQSRDFGSFLTSLEGERRRVRTRERQLLKLESGRAELAFAAGFVRSYLERQLRNRRAPRCAMEFLTRCWSRLLLRGYLQRNSDRAHWSRANELTRRLVAVASVGEGEELFPGDAQGEEIGELLIEARNRLDENGLFDQCAFETLSHLAALLKCEGLSYAASTDEPPELAGDQRSMAELITLEKLDWEVVGGAMAAYSSLRNAENAFHRWYVQLPIGSWVERHDELGNRQRSRLLAVIAPSEICLFVDGIGNLVERLHSSEVMQELESGAMRRLDDRSVLELMSEPITAAA